MKGINCEGFIKISKKIYTCICKNPIDGPTVKKVRLYICIYIFSFYNHAKEICYM